MFFLGFPRDIFKISLKALLRSSERVKISYFFYCAYQEPVKMSFLQCYLFYFSPNQIQTHLHLFKVLNKLWGKISFESKGFKQTLRQNFIWIQQQVKNFPIDPYCKWELTVDKSQHIARLWGHKSDEGKLLQRQGKSTFTHV